MPQENVTPYISLVAGAAIAPYLRLKHGATDGEVDIAGDENMIGTAKIRAYKSGDPMTVTDIRAPGTRIFIADGAIALGDAISSAVNGQVTSGQLGVEDYGVALTAATAAGERIEATLI